MSLPTDLTSLVHLIVRRYNSNWNLPGTSSSDPLQLKSPLPHFKSLSRSVRSFVASDAICCSIVYCFYVSDNASSVSVPRTVKERAARLRQNPWYRDYKRLHDRSARQAARSDGCVRHAESSSRRASLQSEEVKLKEPARDRSTHQAARSYLSNSDTNSTANELRISQQSIAVSQSFINQSCPKLRWRAVKCQRLDL